MRYQFIDDHSEQFSITMMCRVLEVSPSGYYAWRGRVPGTRSVENELLDVAVRTLFKESGETYGSPRICRDLRLLGKSYGLNRVARLMRAVGLKARHPRRFTVTTDSDHDLPIAENILNRGFAVAAPNRVWVSDITYVPTAQGWLYLTTVLDLYSRRIIGWALSNSLHAEHVVKALKMSLRSRSGEDLQGLLFHSDRGSQYASDEFRQVLFANGITQSMSRRGNCWDNAPAESFFSTLKVERIHRRHYLTREQARVDIFHYIEVFYNRKRSHSKLGYIAPLEYERRHQRQKEQDIQEQDIQPQRWLNAA
jgi:transposase InsO family protein